MRVAEVVARGHDAATVKKVERLLYLAEYKRRQAAPGVKITKRNFGRDRRYPITNKFRIAASQPRGDKPTPVTSISFVTPAKAGVHLLARVASSEDGFRLSPE